MTRNFARQIRSANSPSKSGTPALTRTQCCRRLQTMTTTTTMMRTKEDERCTSVRKSVSYDPVTRFDQLLTTATRMSTK